MAMIDYGAIAWKNGKLISTEMFTPMKDMVGWDDSDLDVENPLVNNYFAYIGDKDFTIMFYKDIMRIYCSESIIEDEMFYFSACPFEGWRRWKRWYFVNSIDELKVKVKVEHGGERIGSKLNRENTLIFIVKI